MARLISLVIPVVGVQESLFAYQVFEARRTHQV